MTYSLVKSHRSMVFDHRRNSAYANAIKRLIKPGDVVLDLGSGLGMLGLIAARAGARRVYMVEPKPVIEAARQVAAANAGETEVVFHKGRIEDIELPERVDAILSVFTGNFLLNEDLLPSLFYARDKYLKSGGVMLPDRAAMLAVPINLPNYFSEQIAVWTSQAEGLDFSVCRGYAANTLYYPPRDVLASANRLSSPEELTELDFSTATRAECRAKQNFIANTAGTLHGWLGWFDMRLGENWYSTGPEADDTHWSLTFLPIDSPMAIEQGDDIELELIRPQHGDWTWRTKTANGQRQHSSFFSAPCALSDAIKNTLDYQPALTAEGNASLFVLTCFAEMNLTNAQVAEQLVQHYPQHYASLEQALALVRKLALRYG